MPDNPYDDLLLADVRASNVLSKHDVLAAQCDLNRINHRNRMAYRYLVWHDLDVFEQLFEPATV